MIGAWVAARRRTDAPLVHGILTAFAAYAVVALFGLVLRRLTDRDVDAVPLVFNAFIALSAGSLGGYLASRSV